MRSLRRILVLFVPLLLLAGCTAGRARGSSADDGYAQTTVRVENRSWSAVNVYVLRGSQRIRLGMVNAVSTEVLVIRPQILSGLTTVRFLIDPVGSNRTPISEEITVREGDEVRLYVPNT